jgi:hypothetical protein
MSSSSGKPLFWSSAVKPAKSAECRAASANRAMRMLNGAIDRDNVTFGVFNCEKLFRDVWEAYLEDAAHRE